MIVVVVVVVMMIFYYYNNNNNNNNNNNDDDDDDDDDDDNDNNKKKNSMIAIKGANQDFYNLLTALQTVFNTYAQVARAQSCTYHVKHIVYGGTAQLLSLTVFNSHLF